MNHTDHQAPGSSRISGTMNQLKVVAINASPHKDNGNTALILGPFLEGMKEAGAEVQIFYTNNLKVNPCRGDVICFCRKSGRCIQSDDMDWLVPKARDADVLVFASPIYTDGVTGPMKMVIDRLVPLITMPIEVHEGHCRHVPRDEKVRKIVFASNCGLWEKDNFDPAIAHMKAIARNINAEFVGALIRPHGMLMNQAMELGLAVDEILSAARQAGHELAITGTIADSTLDAISRDLLPRDQYMIHVNHVCAGLCERLGNEN
ncbi:flavodoxin family protein [Methanospirillum lacunae]|uniref:Flavodoxin family protein n=2 Tax=Methanospirillum lacunae TaxID=668570 RepID=A0A2V2NAE0_9EURY|nr:flavodoxin family protein [Methanospirillum lacunae]PWR72521.1 flavodoxin family protein [Methanospirillum lacunae]